MEHGKTHYCVERFFSKSAVIVDEFQRVMDALLEESRKENARLRQKCVALENEMEGIRSRMADYDKMFKTWRKKSQGVCAQEIAAYLRRAKPLLDFSSWVKAEFQKMEMSSLEVLIDSSEMTLEECFRSEVRHIFSYLTEGSAPVCAFEERKGKVFVFEHGKWKYMDEDELADIRMFYKKRIQRLWTTWLTTHPDPDEDDEADPHIRKKTRFLNLKWSELNNAAKNARTIRCIYEATKIALFEDDD